MANRPRRPRSDGTPSKSGEGAPSPAVTGSEKADTVPAPEDTASGSALRPDGATPSLGGLQAADGPGSSLETGAGGRADPSALPAPQDQPEPSNEAERRRQSGDETSSQGESAEPTIPDADTEGGLTATEHFAAEEGLAAKADEPARRDLGEFEDDDAPGPERDALAVSRVTDAYHDDTAKTAAETPHSTQSSISSLVGAGAAGAVLALLGASLLGYAGLMPGRAAAPEAGQFAQAGDLEAVSSELATLRESVGQLQSAEAAGGTGASFASESDLAAVSDRLAAAEQTLQDRAEALDASSGAAEAAQGTADSAQVTSEEARELATQIATRVNEVETRLAAIETAGEQARIALAAAGLKAAIDRGGPFMPELESFAAAGGGSDAVEPLREFAANGVPTQADLVSRWPQVEEDIRRALVQPDADAGLGGQLAAGFSSLVTVRSTEDPGDDASGPDATLARMSAALQAGDLGGWIEARGALDQPAQDASAEFASQVEAREQASSVVDTALAGATGAPDTQD